MMETSTSLKGHRLLVVEDDYFIVEDLLRALEQAGAEIVGPASNLEQALELADTAKDLHGAVLDINIQGEFVYPLADKLLERAIPFVFLTGYDREVIPARFSGVKHLGKPISLALLSQALFG